VRADSAAYQAANNGSDGLRPLKSPGDLLNIVSLKWRNHATMETAVDKICETCRYWSELAMRSPGPHHSLEAFCLNREGAFYRRFCRGAERCPSWASGHLGAIDDPDLPEGDYANEGG
jgi:hypothetical protein